MKASETKFLSIIEGTKQFLVPLFQRAYSWERSEWKVLWDDLDNLSWNKEPKSHFIGSIVTIPASSTPQGVAKYLLIDGQQRLTTVFILLALLRNNAQDSDNEPLAHEIHQTMLVNYFKKGNEHFKLLPTQADREAFKQIIQFKARADLQIDSQITQCYKFFERQFKKDIKDGIDILKLKDTISQRLSIVSITLDRDDNPHLVFESLNAKGRSLTQSDLIRNYFFMRIETNEQEQIYVKYWQPMQQALEKSLTEFIRHYLMRDGAFIKKSDVYFTLKDRITGLDALSGLKELATFATYYEKLLSPEKERYQPLSRALARLNRLDVTTVYPFMLNCYHDYAQGVLSGEMYVEIVETIENFIIRRFICGIQTHGLNKVFPNLYRQALQQEDNNDFLMSVRSILQQRGYPKDGEFSKVLEESRLYGAGQRGIKTKFILETIELSYQHKEQVPFDKLSIEHVMPQTLTEWWQEHLGEDWQINHNLYLHRLGNLTLTAYNSELSNSPFPKKRKRLANSHLELNRYFENLTRWDCQAIQKRAVTLIEQIIKVWPYFGKEDAENLNDNRVTGKTPTVLIILQQKILVKSWREVLTKTMNIIHDLEPDLFDRLAQEYPAFLSKDVSRFRRAKKLNNEYYVEINLSSRRIYSFCTQVIEFLEWGADDWAVEMR